MLFVNEVGDLWRDAEELRVFESGEETIGVDLPLVCISTIDVTLDV